MKSIVSRAFILAVALCVICLPVLQAQELYSCGDVVSPDSVGLDSEKLVKIGETVEKWIENEKIVGASAMILREGKVGFYDSWGQQNREKELPIKRNTIFRIYSMSKPITSVAAMQLIEQGKMKLDDPISKYIVEFKDATVVATDADGESKEVPAERDITVRDLMTHTSGLTYGFFGNTEVDQAYRKAGILISDTDLSQTVEKLGKIPLLMQPGTRFHYSVSSDVLGRVVEVVSKQTLAEYFQEHIFEPLGMQDTSFMVPKEKQDRFAEMYTENKTTNSKKRDSGSDSKLKASNPIESFRFNNPKNKLFSGGGGLCSTIDDYGRFAMMLVNHGELDGTRILKEQSVKLMFTNQLDRAKQSSGQFKFGLGFSITNHGKNGLDYGWGGAAGTRFWVNPSKNTVVLFMVQIKPTNGQFGETIRDLAYDALD